jgi:hypothetical protein
MPAPSGHTLIEPTSWPAQRWLYCRQALRQRSRRWAGWAAMALLLANIGSNDPVATTLGLIGLAVMPLFAASQAGPLTWCVVTLAYGAVISLLLRALRPVLWSDSWVDSVRALPVSPASLRRSDRLILVVALTPVAALLGTGWAVWTSHAPGTRWAAAAAIGCALAGAGAAGVWLLRRWRNPAQPRQTTASQPHQGMLAGRLVRPLPAWRALVWLALWHGPGQRTGRWGAGGAGLILGLGGGAICAWPAHLPWALAATSLGSWIWLTRTATVAEEELAPLLALAASHLPLPAARLRRWQHWTVLGPAWALVSALAVLAAWAAPAGLLRPAVWCAWWLSLLTLMALEVVWPPPEVANRSARWWFFSVLLCALSSEVLQ